MCGVVGGCRMGYYHSAQLGSSSLFWKAVGSRSPHHLEQTLNGSLQSLRGCSNVAACYSVRCLILYIASQLYSMDGLCRAVTVWVLLCIYSTYLPDTRFLWINDFNSKVRKTK